MMITTTHGLMDETDLVQKTGTVSNDVEETHWTEYYLEEELVHRSVHVHLKHSLASSADVGGFPHG